MIGAPDSSAALDSVTIVTEVRPHHHDRIHRWTARAHVSPGAPLRLPFLRNLISNYRALTIALLVSLLFAISFANAQTKRPKTSDVNDNATTFETAQLTVTQELSSLFYDVDNDIFACTLANGPLQQGDVIDVMASKNQTWSVNTVPLPVGTAKIKCPIIGAVKGLNGDVQVLLPALMRFKVDIPAGRVLHSTGSLGFDIESTRSIKAGDTIAVLFVSGPATLAIEATDRTADKSEAHGNRSKNSGLALQDGMEIAWVPPGHFATHLEALAGLGRPQHSRRSGRTGANGGTSSKR